MATPAQWQTSLVLDQILTTTVQNYMRTLYEQVLTNNFLYFWLYSRDRITTMDGGEAIVVPLMYALNETVKSYDSYDELDVSPQDGLTPARYEWRQIAGTLAISRKEERQNSGRARMLALLQAKADQLKMSFQEVLGEMAFKDGSGGGGKDLLGLDALIEDGGTFGTVGGINSNTYTWWRNQRRLMTDFGATFATAATALGDVITGQTAVRALYRDCTKGTQQPDLAITYVDTYGEYEAALSDKLRYTDTDTVQAGFQNIRVYNAVLSWDADYINGGAVGLWYFINSMFLGLVVDTETNFTSTPMIRPHNQDARASQILLMGNLVAKNRARQGVLDGIT